MSYQTSFEIRIKLGLKLRSAVKEVKELEDSINYHMSSMGVNQPVHTYYELPELVVTINGKEYLTEADKTLIVAKYIEHTQNIFPDYEIDILSSSSKSVTPKLSVV